MKKMWSDSAWNDYVWWQSQDKKTLKRINKLIRDIERSANEQVSPRDKDAAKAIEKSDPRPGKEATSSSSRPHDQGCNCHIVEQRNRVSLRHAPKPRENAEVLCSGQVRIKPGRLD